MNQQIYRIGRGTPSGQVNVSFDPADHRRCQNLLAWFERGGEPGATLLIDNWKLCAESDPGLAESVRWIAATAREVEVIITAEALSDVPEPLRPLVRLDFLVLHGLGAFTRSLAWKGRWWKVPVGVDPQGKPVVVELTHFAEGKWRTGSHLRFSAPGILRSLVLGLMATHSPKMFQAIFIDAHDTDTFAGLDQAPHVQAHHRDVARDPALIEQIADTLLAESERRLEVVGNTWTIFGHRDFDQVLPQLLICINGLPDIIAAEPDFAIALTTIAEDVRQSGVQLLIDGPHDSVTQQIADCTTPADLDQMADSLPQLMRRAGPPPGFFDLHEMPHRFDKSHAWRPRRGNLQYRVAVGADEDGQPIEIDIKSGTLQDGMGPHGQVIGPAEQRGEVVRSMLLGQMLRHSPDELQVVLIDFHGTGVFSGLDSAPHVFGSFSHLAEDPPLTDRIVEALRGDHERRIDRLVDSGNFQNTFDYRRSRSNGLQVGPLPELLICIDGVHDLLAAHPDLDGILMTFGRVGRSYGQHLLLSDLTSADDLKLIGPMVSYRLELTDEGWVRRISRSAERFAVPADLDAIVRSLPAAMRNGEPARDALLPPPLHEWSEVTLDQFRNISPEQRAVPIGLRDAPFEHRVDVFWAVLSQGGHGAIVGKPGSGRTTALRTLAESITRTFGSTNGFHLEDGPLYGRPEAQQVVVTASTWAEVPQFIRDSLAWGVELKLAEPAGSIVDERRQANLPDRPGTGLCVHTKQQVRIATS